MADLPISGLPPVVTPLPGDDFIVNNDGVSRQMTRQQMHSLEPGEILLLPNGSDASNPELQFPNSGVYEDAVDQISIAQGGLQVAHGIAPAMGGLYVNNLSTGSGLERVLTTSDAASFGEYAGEFDASSGSLPGGGVGNAQDWYNVTVAGTVDGQPFIVGDILIALVDNASTTTFAANWSIVPHIGAATLDDLTDVVLTAPASTELLSYDGFNWINQAIDAAFQGIWDHDNIQNVGTNTHSQIDTHIADASIHFTVASLQPQITDLYSSSEIHVSATDFGGSLRDT